MKTPRGFTLIELMIVVAIIAILVAIVSEGYRSDTACRQGVVYFVNRDGIPTSPVIDPATKEPKLCIEKP